jgi:type IV pilus assembly protein PilW
MKKTLIGNQKGLTLLEVVIAMTIGLIILGALSGTFQLHRHLYSTQDQVNEMMETARASMDMVIREVKLAGYNPSAATYTGIPYYSNLLRIRTDLNGDGLINNVTEDIVYLHDSSNLRILRIPISLLSTTTDFGQYILADNIQAFNVIYLDKNSNATTNSTDIQKVRVEIMARTAGPDPDYSANNGYRTFTLRSMVTPMNLSL